MPRFLTLRRGALASSTTSGLAIPRVEAVGSLLCLGGATLGGLGLVGWIVGRSSFTTILHGQPPMMPNTAVALLLTGAAGALLHGERVGRVRRTLSLLVAIVVLLIGVATLAEYALGVSSGVDALFVRSGEGPYPGRPSPPTALALTFLAGALLLFDLRPAARARPSEWLILCAGFLALAALFGQAFGVGPVYRLSRAPVVGVALPTALSLLLTSAGLLLERPRAGVMRMATSPGPGGLMFRRLAPGAVLATAVLGIIVTRLLAALGIDELPLVSAILAVMMTVVGLFLLTLTAVPLDRAHEALELSRAQTRELIEHASDGVFLADLEGRCTDVNGAGCRMLGYTREEIVGKKTIMDLLPPEDVERFQESRKQLDAGGTHIGEWTLCGKDGTNVPVEVSAKILPGGRLQGIVRDISERRRAAEALRLSEAKFSGIFSISPDAIVSIDESQRITEFNAAAEKIFGYSRAEVLGAPLDILIPERLRAVHRHHVDEFAAGQNVSRRLSERASGIVGLRSSGEEFPADAAISKLEVGGKAILTATVRDITELKRVENEQRFLAEVGAVFAGTLEYEDTLSNIARLAVRDFADLCIVDIVDDNGEVRRLKVVSRDSSKAWACDLLMQNPPDAKRSPLLRSILETGNSVLLEKVTSEVIASWARSEEHLRALRDLDPSSLIAVPLRAHGKLLGVVGLVSASHSRTYGPADVRFADEIAGRAALALDNARLYRAAQRASQARDDVLGIVAHDLRNPLGTILMQAALLRPRAGEPERRARRPAETIDRAATRMNRLIRDLLDATRIDAGSFGVEQVRVPTAQFVVDSVEAQTALAASSSLEIRLDLAPELPDVYADRDRLLQVLENLIGNALKFTEPGGRITVGAAPRRDDGVLFWVADAGVGIAAEDLPHLFDRFWQARKPGHRGVGLGLAIVKGIVEAHGGRVWVESTPGRGSTFFFTIPTALPGASSDE